MMSTICCKFAIASEVIYVQVKHGIANRLLHPCFKAINTICLHEKSWENSDESSKLGTEAWGVTLFCRAIDCVHVGKRIERQIKLHQPHIMIYDIYEYICVYIYIHPSVYIDNRYSCCCLTLIFCLANWKRKKCWACLWFASTTFSLGFVRASLPLIQMAIDWWQRHVDRRSLRDERRVMFESSK